MQDQSKSEKHLIEIQYKINQKVKSIEIQYKINQKVKLSRNIVVWKNVMILP